MKKRIVIGLLLLVVGALGVGAYMMHNMMDRGFSTRTEPMQMEKVLATTIRGRAIPLRYKTMKNPVAVTPEVIHEGMAHWADHCTTCHANNGGGDTMYGKTMYPRPPDMRQKDTQEMSDGELYYTIKNGVRLSGMPAFGDSGDDDVDSWKLVAFIRHLPQLDACRRDRDAAPEPKVSRRNSGGEGRRRLFEGRCETSSATNHNAPSLTHGECT